jgi:hypothetical protein
MSIPDISWHHFRQTKAVGKYTMPYCMCVYSLGSNSRLGAGNVYSEMDVPGRGMKTSIFFVCLSIYLPIRKGIYFLYLVTLIVLYLYHHVLEPNKKHPFNTTNLNTGNYEPSAQLPPLLLQLQLQLPLSRRGYALFLGVSFTSLHEPRCRCS